jgi:glycosyltransferase involved in cell wall biosynthesis
MPGRRSLRRAVSRVAEATAWNGRWLRARCRRRKPGVTVVIVNFNGDGFVQVAHSAIRRFTPEGVPILVVDNASSDGSVAWLRDQRDIDTVFLRRNVGHGLGLDLGFHRVRTTHVIALDADAFPISDRWMRTLLDPLDDPNTFVVGAETWRPYAHPCALAMRTEDFVAERCTFRGGKYAGRWCDVGEIISLSHPGRVRLIPVTESIGPGIVGSVFGDVVYHNFYGARFHLEDVDVLDERVKRDDVSTVWKSAVSKYLGDDSYEPPGR